MKKNILIIAILIFVFTLLVLLIFLVRNREQDDFTSTVRLNISSNIQEAEVYVGLEGPFIPPRTIYLPPGEYYVWAYKDGYYTIEKDITLEQEMDIFLNFEEIPRELIEEDDFVPQDVDPYPY